MIDVSPTPAPRVFISYSHDTPEHADRVLAMSARLRSSGIETILDRYEDPPEVGWPRWMARGIRDADFVLMVCTDTYYRRVMGDEEPGQGLGVRWEGHMIFNHLHDAGTLNRRFIPVLFGAEHRGSIPDPLRGFSFYEISTDAGYESLYRRLTAQPGVEIPPLGTLQQLPVPNGRWSERPPVTMVGVPRIPRYYLERTPELDALKAKLLADGAQRIGISGSGAQFGLHGMAGIGKTMLAAALCRAPEVAQRFTDGIVWITLGQNAALERRQADLYACFASTPATFEDMPSGRLALGRLLKDKKCLVVVDDVWRQADARAFDVVGPEGALLVTTRDSGIVRSLGFDPIALGTLDAAQGARLLAASSGCTVAELTAKAHELVEECGCLPLAIAMVGGMVHGIADPWPAALKRMRSYRLDQIRQEFPDYSYPDLLRAMQASTDNLPPYQRDAYRVFAVFPEDTHVPPQTLELLWSSDTMDELETSLMIRDLTEKSLLFKDEHGRVFVHDVQRAFLMRSTADLPALHARLLDRYAALCSAGWSSGPDDGYFFEHVVHHLVASERVEEALALLTDSEWLRSQLHRQGIVAILSDCDALIGAEFVGHETRGIAQGIREAVKLAGHRLEEKPDTLVEQMHGRLRSDRGPAIHRLLNDAWSQKKGVWLRPVFASLDQPGGPLLRTIEQTELPAVVLGVSSGRILSASGPTLRLYDEATGTLLRTLESHDAEIEHAAISADGALLASASQDGIIKFFNLVDGACIATHSVPESDPQQAGGYLRRNRRLAGQFITRIASIPESTKFVGADSSTGGLWLIDTRDFSFTHLDVGHTSRIRSIAVPPAGNCIISAGDDATIRVWDLAEGELVRTAEMPYAGAYAGEVGAVVATSNGRVIAASSWSGPLRVWDLPSGKEICTIGDESDFSVAMLLSPDGQTLYEGGYLKFFEQLSGIKVIRYKYIRAWDVATGASKGQFLGHSDHLTSLAFSDDRLSLISASADNTIKVWRRDAVEAASTAIDAFGRPIKYVDIAADGLRMLAAHEGAAASFETQSGRKIMTYDPRGGTDADIEGAAFSTDGRTVLLVVARGDADARMTRVETYDSTTGALLRTFQEITDHDNGVAYLQGFKVTPDGRYAIAVGMLYGEVNEGGFANQALVIWSVETGEIAAVVHIATPNHGKPFAEDWPAAVSADSRYYCFATLEDEFRLCDLSDNFHLSTFGEHQGWIGGPAILPKTGIIITAGGRDQAIRAWSLETGELAREWTKKGETCCIAVSPSERYLVVGNMNCELSVLSSASGEVVATFHLDSPAAVLNASWTRPMVVVGDENGKVHTFSVENCPDW